MDKIHTFRGMRPYKLGWVSIEALRANCFPIHDATNYNIIKLKKNILCRIIAYFCVIE